MDSSESLRIHQSRAVLRECEEQACRLRQTIISYTAEPLPCKIKPITTKQYYMAGHSTWQPPVQMISRVNDLRGLIEKQTCSNHSMHSTVSKVLLARAACSPANFVQGKALN